MKLYFSPLACSLSSRIALYEAKAPATFVYVDSHLKKTGDGRDYYAINTLGLVPVLETADGERFSENTAVLQLIAEKFPEAGLAPQSGPEKVRLQQWLGFIATELHKATFVPIMDKKAPPEVQQYALAKAEPRLRYVAQHLEKREHLLEKFSVADAYLFAILNWAQVTPIDLDVHPSIRAFQARLFERPSVARAFEEEKELYLDEVRRHH